MSDLKVYKELNTSYVEGIKLLKEFNELLHEERKVIEDQDIDNIQPVIEKKTAKIAEIEKNFESRTAIFVSKGLRNDQAGFEEIIKDMSGAQQRKLTDGLEKLKTSLKETQDNTHVNQSVIYRTKENVTRLMDLMQGKKPENDLYNRIGERHNSAAQNHLGKA